MKDIDRLIDEAIHEEESELLRQIGEEPGFFTQLFGIFGGRTGWVNVYVMVVQTVFFVAGVWAAWMFFLAVDPVAQLRWGLPAAVLLIMALMLKIMVWPSVQTNRLLREMKLIQLQLAQRRHDESPRAGQ
ncbi:MAG: DUF6768 family protein [Rhizobiaceae bacterium]